MLQKLNEFYLSKQEQSKNHGTGNINKNIESKNVHKVLWMEKEKRRRWKREGEATKTHVVL
jgi:hypothetical protein